MTANSLLIYLSATFLTIYGLRSLIAGLKNEKKTFWVNLGYDIGLRKLLKEKYDRVNNIVWGAISLGAGILIFIWY